MLPLICDIRIQNGGASTKVLALAQERHLLVRNVLAGLQARYV